jgi:hypothetical protein
MQNPRVTFFSQKSLSDLSWPGNAWNHPSFGVLRVHWDIVYPMVSCRLTRKKKVCSKNEFCQLWLIGGPLRSFEGNMWFSSCVCSEPGFFRIRWWICANYSTLHALSHMKKSSQVSGAVLMKLERRDFGPNPAFLIFWKHYFTSIICPGT